MKHKQPLDGKLRQANFQQKASKH